MKGGPQKKGYSHCRETDKLLIDGWETGQTEVVLLEAINTVNRRHKRALMDLHALLLRVRKLHLHRPHWFVSERISEAWEGRTRPAEQALRYIAPLVAEPIEVDLATAKAWGQQWCHSTDLAVINAKRARYQLPQFIIQGR